MNEYIDHRDYKS